METGDLVVAYEDNHLICVLKPQNVPCCPDDSGDDSLFDCVKRYIKEKYSKPGNVYLGLVHRLDRPTGGIMVFAKTDKAASRLCAAMKGGGFRKRYLCVLSSVPRERRARLENYLKKNPLNNTVYACTRGEEGAKYASLEYEIVADRGGRALCEVNLHTGRSHQIRVQMASINAPVVHDARYGGADAGKGDLALWAYMLSFDHPVTGEAMRFLSEPPVEDAPWSAFAGEIEGLIAAGK